MFRPAGLAGLANHKFSQPQEWLLNPPKITSKFASVIFYPLLNIFDKCNREYNHKHKKRDKG